MSTLGLIGPVHKKVLTYASFRVVRRINMLSAQHVQNNALSVTWGGTKSLTGVIRIGPTVAKRKVRLYEANTGILISEKWAGVDGSYSFTNLRGDIPYTITSTDHLNAYNDVVAAKVLAT